MTDEQFLAEAKKIRLDINPIGAAEVQTLIKDYLAMPVPIKEKLGKVLGGK